MEKSSFFNAILTGSTYDRVYTAEDFARYFASFIGNGVFPTPASNLQVTADGTMRVKLKPGKAWINGYFYDNTEDLSLNVDVADGVLSRVDRVVIRLDFLNRQIKAYVKKGTPATYPLPVAPPLTRNNEIYELGLANISINKGVTGVVQADITDLRANTSLCGYVAGVVQQIDTTNLFAQFQSSFDIWFNSMKGQLSTDAAGNLQNQIDNMKIGGRNLLSNGNFVKGLAYWSGGSLGNILRVVKASNYSYLETSKNNTSSVTTRFDLIKKGDSVTVSFRARQVGTGNINSGFMISNPDASSSVSGGKINFALTNVWKEYSLTFVARVDGDGTQGMYLYSSGDDNLLMNITDISVVIGGKSAGYIQAVEELNNAMLGNVGEINRSSNGFNTKNNGEIEQWGVVEINLEYGFSANTIVQFPKPFPNECRIVNPTVDYDITGGSTAAISGVIANASTSTLKPPENKTSFWLQLGSTGVGSTEWVSGTRKIRIKWRATGY